MADAAGGQQLLDVAVELAAHERFELGDLVDIVDHAQVDVVGTQTLELVIERRANLLEIARAHVLAVLPRAANMPLDDPAITLGLEGFSKRASNGGVGHPAVDYVHAGVMGVLQQFAHLVVGHAADPLRAEPDDADLETRLPQPPVLHLSSPDYLYPRSRALVECSYCSENAHSAYSEGLGRATSLHRACASGKVDRHSNASWIGSTGKAGRPIRAGIDRIDMIILNIHFYIYAYLVFYQKYQMRLQNENLMHKHIQTMNIVYFLIYSIFLMSIFFN